MDKLEQAQQEKWIEIYVAGVTNPNREDGKFRIRKWTFRHQRRFGPGLIRLAQDFFKQVDTLDAKQLFKDFEHIKSFKDLEAMKVNWGDLFEKHADFMNDVITYALMPNFGDDLNKTQAWVDENIDFFEKKNAITLIKDIILLQFGHAPKKELAPQPAVQ